MARNDDDNLDGRLTGEQPEGERDPTLQRLLYVVLIAILLSLASTILTALTIVQFIVIAVSKGEPNERLADFGTDLGIWMAKAARYQAAASEVKPWPWTDLD
ncbi:MAG TPA: DUF4389 domain-containing protein [Roseibacterium sp.]|nr:DUF4389 domain-containing protein [Roseibacterium sp.]